MLGSMNLAEAMNSEMVVEAPGEAGLGAHPVANIKPLGWTPDSPPWECWGSLDY